MVNGAAAPAYGTRRHVRLGTRRDHVLVLVNPRASRFGDRALAAATRTLGAHHSVTTVFTEARRHATELAQEAAMEGFDAVAVVGGDGTVNEVAAGLAGSPTALACLPVGCTNVFARSLGTPRRVVDAAARIADGTAQERLVDLGIVNGRTFLCTSGVGFSASMTAVADEAPGRKAALGQLHFAGAAALELGRRYLRTPPRMRVEAGGRTEEGVTVVVQNSAALTYFGPRRIEVCGKAGLDSGAISLTLLRRSQPLDVSGVLLRLIAGGVGAHAQVETLAGLQEAAVVAEPGHTLPVEADGEYLGEHERVVYGVVPQALRVLV